MNSQVANESTPIPGAATLGMALFLASLAVLFGASMVGFLAVRQIDLNVRLFVSREKAS